MRRRQAMLPGMAPPPVTRKQRKLAHVVDAGENHAGMIALFRCPRCRWESDWTPFRTVTDAKAGIPCEPCNQPKETDT